MPEPDRRPARLDGARDARDDPRDAEAHRRRRGRYAGMLRGDARPGSRERAPWEGVPALRDALTSSGEALIAIAEAEQPGRILRGTRGDGTPYELPAWLVLTQAINHAT